MADFEHSSEEIKKHCPICREAARREAAINQRKMLAMADRQDVDRAIRAQQQRAVIRMRKA